MQESIKAVYGGGFDGYQYLKRFFAFEYKLPSPSRATYCLTLVAQHPRLLDFSIASGLPNSSIHEKNQMEQMAFHLETIGSAFNLSLRSLKQIAFISEAALAGNANKKIFPLYLFMLASVLHRSPPLFEGLQRGVSKDKFLEILGSAGFNDLVLKFAGYSADRPAEGKVGLSAVLYNYHSWALEDLKILREKAFDGSGYRSYPDSLLLAIAEEMPGAYQPHDSHPPSLRRYAELLKAAGYLHQ
jgi:hypothetical protein